VKVKGHVIRTGVSVPFTSGSSLQRGPLHRWRPGFQVSVPFTSGSSLQPIDAPYDAEATICFSSLYIGILAATCEDRQVEPAIIEVSVPFTSGSSLQQRRDDGMLRAIRVSVPFTSGSSLQLSHCLRLPIPYTMVSVPFTSGSSLQLLRPFFITAYESRFSSLYIGILAATDQTYVLPDWAPMFQFPLHRDPRCNTVGLTIATCGCVFQFPLHRDPRCNQGKGKKDRILYMFQFPLHRDPRCNYVALLSLILTPLRFSSLYIGILAAT